MVNEKTIKVTQEDIDNGLSCNAESCPIALACNRALNWSKSAVSEIKVRKHYFDNVGYFLPDNARAFVQNFDTNQKVSPIEFELDI